MRDNIDLALYLRLLDKLSIRTHTLLGKSFGELVTDEGGSMQTGERDELPAIAEFGEALDVSFLFVTGHGRFPVEGWGEVIGESEHY